MKEEFPLAPLRHSVSWLLVAAWVALMLVAYLAPPHQQAASHPVPWWLVIPFATALPLVGPWVMLLHRRIRIEDDKLIVAAALLFSSKVAVTELVLHKARVLDLDEHTEFKPMLQLGGIGLPDFRAGRYLLRNRSRAFCLLTNRDRVLVLPRHDGRFILLSPEKPQALLSRLREAVKSCEVVKQRLPDPKLARPTARR